MNRKTILMILTFFVLTLFPVCALEALRTSENTPRTDLSIPYEGLVLRWESNTGLYYENLLQIQQNETWIYIYLERNSPTIFKRQEISPERIDDPVDAVTREVLSGPFNGTVTSHWIGTNHSVGDLVPLYLANITYAVRTINVNAILPSVAPKMWGAEIRCFELESTGVEGNWTYNDLIYYEMITGIKVLQNTTSFSTSDPKLTIRSIQVLEETQKDTDEDGLTDLEELFVTSTNPQKSDTDNDGLDDEEEYKAQTLPLNPDSDMDGLKDWEEVKILHSDPLLADSDGDGLKDGYEVSTGADLLRIDTDNDLWNDAVDIMPINALVPNALIVFLVALPVGALIWWWKMKRVRVEVSSTSTVY